MDSYLIQHNTNKEGATVKALQFKVSLSQFTTQPLVLMCKIVLLTLVKGYNSQLPLL